MISARSTSEVRKRSVSRLVMAFSASTVKGSASIPIGKARTRATASACPAASNAPRRLAASSSVCTPMTS